MPCRISGYKGNFVVEKQNLKRERLVGFGGGDCLAVGRLRDWMEQAAAGPQLHRPEGGGVASPTCDTWRYQEVLYCRGVIGPTLESAKPRSENPLFLSHPVVHLGYFPYFECILPKCPLGGK